MQITALHRLKFRRNGVAPMAFSVTTLNWPTALTDRTYSGPRGSGADRSAREGSAPLKEFDTLDGALVWAGHLDRGGSRIALLIEGDDGTPLGHRQIAAALRHGAFERGS